MTCAELRLRLVDPSSAGHGGHAGVVEHLGTCAECRALARSFGALERALRPESAGEPPADVERRVLDRLAVRAASAGGGSTRRLQLVVGAAAAVAILAAVAFAIRRPASDDGTAPAPVARRTPTGEPSADSPPPAILAVNSGRVSVLGPPLSEEDRRRVTAISDLGLLRSIPLLGRLDPLFPQDLAGGTFGPEAPGSERPVPRPTDTPERLAERLEEWRQLGPADRSLLESVDAELHARPAQERRILAERWETFSSLGPEDRSGLSRIAGRFEELDARRLQALKSELRAIASLPREKRPAAWRAHPFARSLTGQELQGAEKLLLSW